MDKPTLTREQMDAVIERANMAPKHKQAMRKGLDLNHPETRFAVYALWLRQGKPSA